MEKITIFLLKNTYTQEKKLFFSLVIIITLNFSASAYGKNPAEYFDLTQWKITLPIDEDNNGRVDEVSVKKIKNYSHPNFFYLDKDKHIVFAAPNKGPTTSGSQNTRSELRQMMTLKNAKSERNNFALQAHNRSSKFGSIGGKLHATLKINHVPERSYRPKSTPAFSVVIGQIHAGKDPKALAKKEGFGWGNEPLKIVYKKWPGHNTGSVFWNYELNLSKYDKNRKDISYPVWGNTGDSSDDPGENGIALNQEFSYTVNVYKNTVYLTFETEGRQMVSYSIDLSNNVDAYGKVDTRDHPMGYAQEWFYFKAGVYNQCTANFDYGKAACHGTGVWEKDFKSGDYAQATFSKLSLGKAEPPLNPHVTKRE